MLNAQNLLMDTHFFSFIDYQRIAIDEITAVKIGTFLSRKFKCLKVLQYCVSVDL